VQIFSRRSAEGRRIDSGETLRLARGNYEVSRLPALVHTAEASATRMAVNPDGPYPGKKLKTR